MMNSGGKAMTSERPGHTITGGGCFRGVGLLFSRGVEDSEQPPSQPSDSMIMQVLHCPHCQGTDIIRHGKTRQGQQRYCCQETVCDGRTCLLEYRYWFVDGLMEADYQVHLANPAAMQQYSGLKYTNDRSNARWLAHVLRLGVLPEGYIYPKAERAVRDLLRKRAHVVRQHTANVLSVQNIMARNTGSRFSVKRMQELTKQELTTLLAEETQVLVVTSSLMVLDCLRQQIKTLEQTVHKRLYHTPSYEQLLTVQGIGTILAQTIALETGAISRFPTVGNYASYCRC